jgi:large subunit ribosomal protein L5e
MAFQKVVKTKAYYKRYQVRFRRRREGKTDYYARRRLIQQDKNKYNTKKYRFVVRRTNKRIICQFIYATIQGDRVLSSADSFELKRFGLDTGLTNYAAAYATGLLSARRVLAQLGLNDTFKGVENVDGEFYDVNDHVKEGDKRPFKAFLDVGIIRTTTGNRSFGALKGAVDGGVYIPHNNKRFPGYHLEKKEAQTSKKGAVVEKGKATSVFKAAEHRQRIFGLHVQGYLDHLKKDKKEKVDKQFSKWLKCLEKNKVQNMEALYKKVHGEIRKAPQRVKAEKKAPVRKVISKAGDKAVQNQDSKGRKWFRHKKLNREERRQRVVQKFQKAMQKK